MTAIIIDSREPDYIRDQFPDSAASKLEYGDAWIACDDGHILTIERKTPDDLLDSIQDGRLFEQVAAMTERLHDQALNGIARTHWAYLVITGTFQVGNGDRVHTGQRQTDWRWPSVWGALLTVQELGCLVTFAPSEHAYGKTVMALVNRERTEVVKIRPHRTPVPLDPREAVLCSLPGIGEAYAATLMSWAGGNLAHALAGLTDLELDMPLSRARRQKIRSFLGLSDGQIIDLTAIGDGSTKLVIMEDKNV